MKAWFAAALFILVIGSYAVWLSQKTSPNTDAINSKLMAVVHAPTVAARETALTDSLQWMSQEVDPQSVALGNGNYYLALGDVYRAFQAFPWALWSYRKADRLAPGHPLLAERIETVRKQLDLTSNKRPSVFNQLLFFHHLSIPRRLQLFSLTAILAFGFGSLFIWKQRRLWSYSTAAFGVVATLFLLSCLYTRYVEPAEGVLIEAAILSPSQTAQKGELLIPAGTLLFVLDVSSDGTRLKILTEEGQQGYIPTQKIRLIF